MTTVTTIQQKGGTLSLRGVRAGNMIYLAPPALSAHASALVYSVEHLTPAGFVAVEPIPNWHLAFACYRRHDQPWAWEVLVSVHDHTGKKIESQRASTDDRTLYLQARLDRGKLSTLSRVYRHGAGADDPAQSLIAAIVSERSWVVEVPAGTQLAGIVLPWEDPQIKALGIFGEAA